MKASDFKEIANLANSIPDFLNQEAANIAIEILTKESKRAAAAGLYHKSIRVKSSNLKFMQDYFSQLKSSGFSVKISDVSSGYVDVTVSW
jgi:hypothetical protein